MGRMFWRSFFSLTFLLSSLVAFGQNPEISYRAYHFMAIDSPQFLKPINLGTKVPEKSYGETSTYSGKGTSGLLNGKVDVAIFNAPSALVIDHVGNLFVADEKNNCIRKISINGFVTTYAKGFNRPCAVAIDHIGNVYVADCYNHVIKKILPSGTILTIAGNGKAGNVDHQKGTSAQFNYPVGLAIDKIGDIYVADEGNNKIRKISPDGSVTTYAGTGVAGFQDDEHRKLAKFNQPNGLVLDSLGNLFVADQLNHRIRKIDIDGHVSTFAGTGMAGSVNHALSINASFNNPRALAIDRVGNIYVGDAGNEQIRKIGTDGEVTTIAGSGIAGENDSKNGRLAAFYFPNGLAVGQQGEIYVADALNHKIRKVESTGYQLIPEILPRGLSFNSATGVFSGTPIERTGGSNYTVNAYNAKGKDQTQLSIAVAPQPGNALHFDGFDDQVVILNAPSLTPKKVTVELWVNIEKIGQFVRFVVKRNDKRRFDDSYSLGIDSVGYFRSVMANGNGLAKSQVFAYSKEVAKLNQWYFLSAVYTPDSISLFIDGVLQEKKPSGFPISVGNGELGLSFDKGMVFSMDELRIFDEDRSLMIKEDMRNLISPNHPNLVAYYDFNSGLSNGRNTTLTRLYDLSKNQNHGTLNNFSGAGNRSNWIESYAMVVPLNQKATFIKSTEFTANWSLPKISVADSYIVDVSEDPEFCSFVAGYRERKVTETSLLVEQLKPNTIYYFRVAAIKDTLVGKGVYAETVKLVTAVENLKD